MKSILSWYQLMILRILLEKGKSEEMTVKKLFKDTITIAISLQEELMSQSGLYMILRKFEESGYITVAQIAFSKQGSRTKDIFQITNSGREAYHSSRKKYFAIFGTEKLELNLKK